MQQQLLIQQRLVLRLHIQILPHLLLLLLIIQHRQQIQVEVLALQIIQDLQILLPLPLLLHILLLKQQIRVEVLALQIIQDLQIIHHSAQVEIQIPLEQQHM